MNGILGGFPHSKLFKNVREKEALCYDASSSFERFKGLLFISAGIEGENYLRARELCLAQLEAICRGEIEELELEATRMSYFQAFQGLLDNPTSLINLDYSMSLGGRGGVPADAIGAVQAVTVEGIQAAAERVGLDTVYFLEPDKIGYQKKFALVTVGYGSIDNAFVPPGETERRQVPEGIAHFLEHKLFEDEAGDVFDQFARYGASANAYTTPTETAYHFTTSTHFEECLELLLDFVTDPYFTDEQIEKERGVIAQEIRMYDDDPDARGHLELMRCLYHRHPVRQDTSGTVESIQAIDKPLLELCHRTFYQPGNMVLSIAGDLEPQAVLEQVQANVTRRRSERGAHVGGTIGRLFDEEPDSLCSDAVEICMEVARPKLLIGFKDVPVPPGEATLLQTLRSYLLNELLFGRSSAFYEEHYAGGLIDPSFSHYYTSSRGGYAYALIGGETDTPDALVAAVERRFAWAREGGLAGDDFRRIRNKVVGYYLKGFNSVEQMASREADSHLEGYDLLRYLDLLESITLADLEATLRRLYDPARRALSVVKPVS
jgi:predicted Zn-dependent peptidase